MPKYWGKQILAHGRFLEVGQKQKTERKRKKRLNNGNNNGQLCIATPPQVAHAKPPGPKLIFEICPQEKKNDPGQNVLC